MKDIEIAREAKLKPINEISNKLNIPMECISEYGKYKAKIENYYDYETKKQDGKLVLVTAMNPTPLGEGKTTISIGLADALNILHKKAVLALREPSMGPVFGMKGGATGGGKAQVAPMEDINLHFTGDIHAISYANNLLSAMIDNHIYFGNKLGFKQVIWKRCLDINDRALRDIQINLNNNRSGSRAESFDITAASEIMAIFCLANDLEDLRRRLGNIIVGFNEKLEPIKAKDLKAEGAMTAVLKTAFNPNLVQTLENTPAIIHGGPFANIAHGCNSVVATKLALKLADYTITEAGFGADLGAEKFMDIKCRHSGVKPDAVVCVATIKALKYHGGLEKEKIMQHDISAIEKGMSNLFIHINNIRNEFGLDVVIALNKYIGDDNDEINFVVNKLKEHNIDICIVEAWEKGGTGALDLAQKVIELCDKENNFRCLYEDDTTIKEKIEKVAKNIYRAKDVEYSKETLEKIENIEKMGYGKLPVCIAKTQYSLSDNPKLLNVDNDYKIHVQDVMLKAGAEFVVVITGNIYTMPGLPKEPAAEKIGVDEQKNIYGIF